MTTDALFLSIPLDGIKYPSKNHEGADNRRNGKKSAAYTRVYDDTVAAAKAAMRDTGWTIATKPCLFVVTLIVPTRLRRDAINLATAEANALTEAGAWADDTLANPAMKMIVVDPDGPARISIIVQKLHEPLALHDVAAAAPKVRKPRAKRTVDKRGNAPLTPKPSVVRSESRTWNGVDIPVGQALVDGKLVPIADAVAMIRGRT